MSRVLLYHTTDAAEAILRDGFRDAMGSYELATLDGTPVTLTGVFLADMPVDINEGAVGDEVIEVALPDDLDLDDFELIQDGKPFREWCVPAGLINAQGHLRLMDIDEDDD
jgi:hypothetical protein